MRLLFMGKEEIVNKRKYDAIPALKKEAIKRAWERLDQGEVAKACRTFPDRVRRYIDAKMF